MHKSAEAPMKNAGIGVIGLSDLADPNVVWNQLVPLIAARLYATALALAPLPTVRSLRLPFTQVYWAGPQYAVSKYGGVPVNSK